MMRTLYAQPDGTHETDLTPAGVQAALQDSEGLLWVDLTPDGAPDRHEALLSQVFGFHPLAVDDTLNEIHVPKLDDWQDYLYLVFQGVGYDRSERVLVLPELDVFLGRNYLVTYHAEPLALVDRVWETCRRNPRWLQHRSDHVLYRLIDELVNVFTAVVDRIEDEPAV